MNPAELPGGGAAAFSLRLGAGSGALPPGAPREVVLDRDPELRTLLRAAPDALWQAECADPRQEAGLLHALRMPARVSWIEVPAALATGVRVPVHLRTFSHEVPVLEPLALGIDERIRDVVLQRLALRRGTVEDVARWLQDQLVLASSPAFPVDRALVAASGSSASFRLLGRGIAADVDASDPRRVRIVRVVWDPRERAARPGAVSLLRAPRIRFHDASAAARVRSDGGFSDLLAQVGAGTAYLGLWQDYHALEREAVMRRARAVGALRYVSAVPLPDGSWRLHLSEDAGIDRQLEQLRDTEGLSFTTARRPDGWDRDTAGAPGDREETFRARCVDLSPRERWVRLVPDEDVDGDPLDRGYLVPDLRGHRVRLKRQQDAHERILAGAAAMPQLGLLLGGHPAPTRGGEKQTPRSPAALAAFGGPPTARQLEALDVALNTPDIALIQGPPGTGKTRVITALQTRLSETTRSPGGLAGQLLLTSYQHEAVENAAARTEVFGLPALKVDTLERAESFDALEKWRHQRIAALEQTLGTEVRTPARRALQEARAQLAAYRAGGGTLSDARALLRLLFDLGRDRVPGDLLERIDALESDLDRRRGGSVPLHAARELARAARRLRTSPEAFADDGRAAIRGVLGHGAAADLLSDAERDALAAVFRRSAASAGAADLECLARVRDAVMDRVAEADSGVLLRAVNEGVAALAAELVDALADAVQRSGEAVDEVLADYLDSLRADPHAVRHTLASYTVVLAATCQQSVGQHMRNARGGEPGGRGDVRFDTVLVDEAARANPLDLLIPMARAARRIVLVGDHRQLPHVLDSDVEHELERRRRDDATGPRIDDRLRISLFEHLFYEMRRREAADGIRRTVTLDAQYRMHPVLGAFVSRVFYEPHDEGFDSPRPPHELRHGVASYGDAVAAFVDVPRGRGPERRGRSKDRPAEARWIAAEVERILRAHPGLSIGVVSFYRAQVDRIDEELAERGVVERDGVGRYSARAEFAGMAAEDGRYVDRLRVGTVDAFQGREFDVVFLSMTRSNTLPAGDTAARRRRFGHLMLENRLCVAMSRQRRLLVVVGDAAMLEGEDAAAAVPGLVQFRALCDGKDGVRVLA